MNPPTLFAAFVILGLGICAVCALFRKLNYIIKLLEEGKHEQRTSSTTR